MIQHSGGSTANLKPKSVVIEPVTISQEALNAIIKAAKQRQIALPDRDTLCRSYNTALLLMQLQNTKKFKKTLPLSLPTSMRIKPITTDIANLYIPFSIIHVENRYIIFLSSPKDDPNMQRKVHKSITEIVIKEGVDAATGDAWLDKVLRPIKSAQQQERLLEQKFVNFHHAEFCHITKLYRERLPLYYIRDYGNLRKYDFLQRKLPGVSLLDLKDLPIQEKLQVLSQVYKKMVHLHDVEHMLHLDLTSSNILYDKASREVFIIDFESSMDRKDNGEAYVDKIISTRIYSLIYAQLSQERAKKNRDFIGSMDDEFLGVQQGSAVSGNIYSARNLLEYTPKRIYINEKNVMQVQFSAADDYYALLHTAQVLLDNNFLLHNIIAQKISNLKQKLVQEQEVHATEIAQLFVEIDELDCRASELALHLLLQASVDALSLLPQATSNPNLQAVRAQCLNFSRELLTLSQQLANKAIPPCTSDIIKEKFMQYEAINKAACQYLPGRFSYAMAEVLSSLKQAFDVLGNLFRPKKTQRQNFISLGLLQSECYRILQLLRPLLVTLPDFSQSASQKINDLFNRVSLAIQVHQSQHKEVSKEEVKQFMAEFEGVAQEIKQLLLLKSQEVDENDRGKLEIIADKVQNILSILKSRLPDKIKSNRDKPTVYAYKKHMQAFQRSLECNMVVAGRREFRRG